MPTFWKEPFFGPINVDDVAAVDAAIQKMIAWNRYDLIDSLNWFIFDYGRRRRPVKSTGPSDPIPSPGNQVQLCDPFPYSVPQKLNVHRHSAVAFMKGECGHAYTGLIRRIEGDDKLYLFPLDPVIRTSDKEERRGGRDFPEYMKAKVYKHQPDSPIVHGGRGSDSTSHAQLTQKVAMHLAQKAVETKSGNNTEAGTSATREELVDQIMKKKGLFIGFTVHKGDFKRRVANRFRMVSAGFNGKAFSPHNNKYDTLKYWNEFYKERLKEDYPAGDTRDDKVWQDTQSTIPESWAFLIQKTVDWLLQFQEALEQQRRPLAVTLIWLDGDSLGAKGYWRRIKECPGPGMTLFPSPEEMKA